MPSAVISYLKANAPARRLYAAIGGHVVGERFVEDEGALLLERASGGMPRR
jgi:hypothetical protein